MKYREAKEILAKQKEAQETINRFKGLETFGKRIGYPSNKELIVDLLEMENEENILGLLSNYKDLLNGDKKVTSKQPAEELTPGKKMIIREELDQGKTISEVAKTYELSEDQIKSALPDD
tara:strand:+ start:129 stop:488 length:360 start_codon:yes stop_codon:yes gene_type:complete